MMQAADDARAQVKWSLCVHLANLETLAQEAREIVAAGGEAVDVFRLNERARIAEETLHWAVDAAAAEAGLVEA
jgi:hypothetical protein